MKIEEALEKAIKEWRDERRIMLHDDSVSDLVSRITALAALRERLGVK